MDSRPDLDAVAGRALQRLRAAGFEHAQATASVTRRDELNIAHDEPSLLRSTTTPRLGLVGIVGARRAATELTSFDDAALREACAALAADAAGAPIDEAHAVSAGEHARIVQGPQRGSLDLLAEKVAELLDFRRREAPAFQLQEGFAAHRHVHTRVLTTGGSALEAAVGCYEIEAVGTARDGARASSFNFAGGSVDDPSAARAESHFGIATMMRDALRQTHTQALPARFTGTVVLTPPAVGDLLEWLLEQVGDQRLLGGSSLYRERVGDAVASPRLDVRSRFDAPGVAALSADAVVARPLQLLRRGVLATLLPSLYASRRTGLPHVPTAAAGWDVGAGDTPLASLVAGVGRGALVGRLSMGRPAPNGDFSGLVKNSFLIDGGQVGPALSQVMIAGNVARMLLDVDGVSAERIDYGTLRAPWLRVGGLHFS
ncbi:MAG: metallopeptidase TldD-related protein [Gammaproteobacteria bacterium]